MDKYLPYAVLLLRLALTLTLLAAVADKLGYWGEPGTAHVQWGDWSSYTTFMHTTLFYLPAGIAEKLGTVATTLEVAFALMFLFGLKVRWAAIGTGIYTLLLALALLIAQGIKVPLNYSLFVVSAAGFLLSCCPVYRFTRHGIKKRSTYHPY